MLQLSQDKIDKIRAFCNARPVVRAYLFGSYARGDADEESDIDLFLDLDYANLDALDFLLWHEYLTDELHQKVDVVSGRKPQSRFYQTIEPELRLVYERGA